MKKSIKIPLIILCVILSLVLVLALAAGVIYLYSDLVIFDHRDTDDYISLTERHEGYSVNYPFFGNPMMIGKDVKENGKVSRIYSVGPGSGGSKNIPVYGAVNSPLNAWVEYLALKYDNYLNLDYTLEQDSKTITVVLAGYVTDGGGQNIPAQQKFIFNIENASPDNLPVWVNQNEADEEFKEFWHYLNNTSTIPMPDWYAEKLGIQKAS